MDATQLKVRMYICIVLFNLRTLHSPTYSGWTPPFFLWWQPSQILVWSPPGVCLESSCPPGGLIWTEWTPPQNTGNCWLIQPDSRWSPARLIITSLLLLLYNTKKSVTSMNQTHDLRTTATLSIMNAQPVEPQRLTYICIFYAVYTNWLIAFLERMLANSDTQFGIINHQQHPPSMTPSATTPASPPSPTATATHCCHQPPTTTAHNQQWNNQWWHGNATSQATMTTSTTPDDEEHLKMNTNDPTAHKRWPAPMNGHRRWWAKVRQLTSPPI